MSIRPTFYGFEMARTALSASQRNIDVTGQNIANINTEGYSRQRANLSAIGAGGMEWKYPIHPSENVGMGVNVDSIQRMRDEFLDIRYRKENGDNNRYDIIGSNLNSLSDYLDEFTIDNLHSILTTFGNALQDFNQDADEKEFASLMRSQALKLTNTLNKLGRDIQEVRNQQFEQLDLAKSTVNYIAKSLDDVNNEIRMQYILSKANSNGTYGVSNELLDKRDLLLDQLSNFGQVTVVQDDSFGMWVFFGEVDESFNLTFDAVDVPPITKLAYGDKDTLIDNGALLVNGAERGYNELEFDMDTDPVRLSWASGTNAGGDFITKIGQIYGYYEMMNGSGDVTQTGEYEDLATKGIPYFMNIIDNFAFKFAEMYNSLNDDAGDLFVAFDGNSINAINISISEEWQNDEQYIIRTLVDSDAPGDSRNDNILKMIDALRREDRDFEDGFTGSFQQYIGRLNSEISIEIDYNNKRKAMSDILLLNIDNMRASVKDVSEDEEAMNLARYQKSYNAAARYMTTLDDMLETIVHRLGRAGL